VARKFVVVVVVVRCHTHVMLAGGLQRVQISHTVVEKGVITTLGERVFMQTLFEITCSVHHRGMQLWLWIATNPMTESGCVD
jgi:hypothetical protein